MYGVFVLLFGWLVDLVWVGVCVCVAKKMKKPRSKRTNDLPWITQ